MNAGCAIITTNAAGCAEVVGDAGIKTDPRDVSQIGSALKRLMENDDEVQKYSKLGLQRIQQFSWTNISNRYSEMYNSI
jgi:glycosyltransferase involved in cell wall biosynthesis